MEYQYFPVADQLIANVSFADGSSWQMGAAANGKMSDVPVDSEVIYVEDGTKASDFPENTAGKVVLVKQASSTANYRLQVENAMNAGAEGVIIHSVVGSRGNYGQTFNPNLTKAFDIPVFGAAYIQGEWLKEQSS